MPCSNCRQGGHNRQTCRYLPHVMSEHLQLAPTPNQPVYNELIIEHASTMRSLQNLNNSLGEIEQNLSQEIRRINLRYPNWTDVLNQYTIDGLYVSQIKGSDRSPMPKHISKTVYENSEHTSCIVCLNDVTCDDFILSKCGHNYCKTCYMDIRLTRCAICREEQF